MDPMHSGNFNINESAVNLHSKHGHTFNFVKFLTSFVKSDLYLGTDRKLLSGYSINYWSG